MDFFVSPDPQAKPALLIDGGGGYCPYPDCEPSPKRELAVERMDYFRSQNVFSSLNDWRFFNSLETSPFAEYIALVNPRLMIRILKKHPNIHEKKSGELEKKLAEEEGLSEILLNKAVGDLTNPTSKLVMADLAREFLEWYLKMGGEIEKGVVQETDYEKYYRRFPFFKKFFLGGYTPPLHPSRRLVFDELKKSLEKANDFSTAKRIASVLAEVAFDGKGSGFEKEAEDFLMGVVRKEKPIMGAVRK